MNPVNPTRPHNYHLLTPVDWQREAIRHAAHHTGTPVAARAMVEANRYAMFDAVLCYVRDLERANATLQTQRDKACNERNAALLHLSDLRARIEQTTLAQLELEDIQRRLKTQQGD